MKCTHKSILIVTTVLIALGFMAQFLVVLVSAPRTTTLVSKKANPVVGRLEGKIPHYRASGSMENLVLVDEAWTKPEIENLVKRSKHPEVLGMLIGCESQWTNIQRLDSNGLYSYGVLQIQSSTWALWSQKSGIAGSPMNPADAMLMADWALQNGNLGAWTCSRLTGLTA